MWAGGRAEGGSAGAGLRAIAARKAEQALPLLSSAAQAAWRGGVPCFGSRSRPPLRHIPTPTYLNQVGILDRVWGVIGSDMVDLGFAYFSLIYTLHSILKEHIKMSEIYQSL